MERVRFITHEGKKILLSDLSGATPKDVIQAAEEVKRLAAAEPRGTVLVLSDLSGAEFSKDAVTRIKEVAVYNRPFVRKSAFVAADNLPKVFFDAIRNFSQRDFHRSATREEALDWLVED